MSLLETPATHAVSAAPSHPLDRLTAAEVSATRAVLGPTLTPTTRFAYLGLLEPPKAAVLAFRPGDAVERTVRVLLLDTATGEGRDVRVSLSENRIVSDRTVEGAVEGHLPILEEEFAAIDPILLADERWTAALAARGLEPADVVTVPLSAGHYDDIPATDPGAARVLRVFAFAQPDPSALPWAHPVDGVVAYVDLSAGKVLHVLDHQRFTVPQQSGNWDAAPHAQAERTDLKPISITQPEGPSFSVEGDVISWQGWKVRVGFDAREGLTLHQLSVADFTGPDPSVQRDVVYRASIAEMVVPYADPSPVRFWQNYFDTGEYLFGRFVNSLALGCDCLGEIRYFDAVLADEHGRPRTVQNAICLHEEDYGVLWKHSDMFNGMDETRRQRRLVISFFTTIGNYDYGFYWHLYLDGTIELEAKATGVVFTAAYPEEGLEFSTEIAPGLAAPFHQHLFSARLDVMVDGLANAVEEVEAVRVPRGEGNPYGNAFARRATRLTSEAMAQREADGASGRVWHVLNTERTNALGQPTGYALHPQHQPLLLADDTSTVHDRATFATKHLWVTRYDSEERYPAGDFVNQNPGGAGLPRFVAGDRDLDGQDLVLWHTFGLTHFPRPEDWPVMPVDRTGFTLRPVGFFDRNPALGVPGTPAAPAAAGGGCCSA
ncbi:primary-amine oxidase [Kineococcus rhizosphaerae]|uniref:Amine oxidase n=1 Tax=Kineococcus rhizosphaerae TaxID=559628 RepID=A0A2T0R1G7_9ACTN|nr:primary-amine oxidase [Kineococcus rhizosphaerae]PRY13371.1 primary-amine oxidase [Kineococcus rhizosphaerae]